MYVLSLSPANAGVDRIQEGVKIEVGSGKVVGDDAA